VADPLDTWQNAGAPDLYERAAQKYRELRQGLAPLDLPEDTVRALNDVVARADAALVR
jgi:trimethylamine:corrinoid methyltransferase-like protein